MARIRTTGDGQAESTRDALLRAAAELFAEKGFDGASVREIAKRAGANVAAVNYHYAGKENLYFATVAFVLNRIVALRKDSLAAAETALQSRQGIAETIYGLVDREVRAYMSLDWPQGYAQLILRSLMTRDTALEGVIEQALRPNHVVMTRLIRAASPTLTEREASLWSFSITGQIIFYAVAREPVLLITGQKAYTEDFMKAVVEHIAGMTLKSLGLSGLTDAKQPRKRAAQTR
jgi:AcrR family transcriptional regulator